MRRSRWRPAGVAANLPVMNETVLRATLTYLEAESTRRYVSPHEISAVLIGLGDHDAAIDWLERAYREHDRALVWMTVHPRLDPLRGDPRFDAIVRRVTAPSAAAPLRGPPELTD